MAPIHTSRMSGHLDSPKPNKPHAIESSGNVRRCELGNDLNNANLLYIKFHKNRITRRYPKWLFSFTPWTLHKTIVATFTQKNNFTNPKARRNQIKEWFQLSSRLFGWYVCSMCFVSGTNTCLLHYNCHVSGIILPFTNCNTC